MLRFLWTLLQISAALLLVAYLGQYNSPVLIHWGQYQVEMSLLTLAIGLCVIFALLLALFWLWGKVRRSPQVFQEFRQNRRRDAGYRALTRGMVAVAAGEKFAAQKAANQAENLLQDPPLTMLLSAQSAQLSGDEMAASKYFRRMLDHPEMAFLGWRGLIMQALREGKNNEAQKLLSDAEARFPNQPWLLQQALDFEEKHGNTTKALTLITRAQRAGAFSASEAKMREVNLLLQQGRDQQEQGVYLEAIKSIEKSWKLLKSQQNEERLAKDPVAHEIQFLLGELYGKTQNIKKAEDALQKCWKWHADSAVFSILEGLYADEGVSALQQWKKFKQFFQTMEMSSDGACRLARMAIAAGLIGEAEAALERDPEPDNPAHFPLRAQIAEQKGDAEKQLFWQNKALGFHD